MTLKIGHIHYANCTPIFSALLADPASRSYEFIRGVPAELNRRLHCGDVDVCPSSSIEYAKFPEKYLILPGLSISSIGPVKSVLLFSSVPLEELDGKPVGLTTDSDTSVNLLRVVLHKQFGFRNAMERTPLPLHQALEQFSALLLIGDAALRENMQAHGLFVYDLGEMWYRFTGLPFVFALWLVNRKAVAEKGDEVTDLAQRLLAAKEQACRTYPEIAAECAEAAWMGHDDLIDYWNTISYDLTTDHLAGVATFYRHAASMGIVPREPELCLLGNGG